METAAGVVTIWTADVLGLSRLHGVNFQTLLGELHSKQNRNKRWEASVGVGSRFYKLLQPWNGEVAVTSRKRLCSEEQPKFTFTDLNYDNLLHRPRLQSIQLPPTCEAKQKPAINRVSRKENSLHNIFTPSSWSSQGPGCVCASWICGNRVEEREEYVMQGGEFNFLRISGF